MRLTRALVIYLLAVFVGGALIAPMLYWIGQSLSHTHGLGSLARHPFHRYVDRAVLGLALLGLWPLVRVMGIRSWAELGFADVTRRWVDVVGGFLIGFGSLAILAVAAIAMGARQAHLASGRELIVRLFTAALAGVVVAALEETLFRGALFGAMRKAWRLPTAVIVSSIVYALAHFVQKAPEPETVTWTSGLAMLPQMFGKLADVQQLFPKAVVLTVVGIILALAYERTGALFLSIGLHAGWIFWLKSYQFVSTATVGNATWLWGTDEIINGWLSLLVLLMVLMFVDRVYRPKMQPAQRSL
jgi:uncharacterized protein